MAKLPALGELLDFLYGSPILEAQKGDYAQLADENDEQGLVHVYRQNGQLVMSMPREVWDQLKEMK